MPAGTIGFFELAVGALATEAVVAFVARAALTFAIASVFQKKPKSADYAALAGDLQITNSDPVAAGRVIYGETMLGGTIIFRHTTPAIAGDIEAVSEQHTINDNASIVVQGAANWVSDIGINLQVYLGEDGYSNTLMTAVSSSPAAGQYSVTAGTYTFNTADIGKSVTISYSSNASQRVVGKYLHLVIELACHEVEEIGDIYFDDEVIPLDGSGAFAGRLFAAGHVHKYLGTSTQAADSLLMSMAPDKWTADHRDRGRAYIYVLLVKNPNQVMFPNGVPNIRARVKGRKVYDPRTGLTAWSANPALCLADYLTNTDFGLGHDYATEIDEDLLIAAANVCDESVALAAGGSESRYTCNGVISTADQPKDILGRLKVAMAGQVVRSAGLWQLYAGAYLTPTLTLDEDDLRGPIQVKPRLSRREVFNSVKGVYANPDNLNQPSDFPVVTNATYLAEDADETIWLDMDLPFTGSPSMAQRISKIELERVRQQIVVVMPCKLSAWELVPPQSVMVTNSRFGWSAKVFDVVDVKLVTDAGEGGAPYLGVDLVLRETASSVYDWSSGEETTVDPAPDTDLPNPFAVAPPGTPAVQEQIYQTTGSAGVKSRAVVSWAAAPDAQATQYGLEYRATGTTAWSPRPLVQGLSDTLEDLAPGNYQFRVKALNGLGVSSAYSATTSAGIVGLSAPPAAVSGFSIIKSAGLGVAQWTLHDELDVQINGAIVIRHSPLTTGADWQHGIIVEEFPGGLVSGIVPLITGTYMAKARDSSGNYSASEVSFVATEGLVTGFTTVGTSTQHPAFTGTKTNVAFDSALVGIKLDGSTLIDAMVTSIDSWPFVDGLGGISATGSYAFDATLDLTTVATRRFEADIRALSFDTGDTIDNRLDDIDTWDSIDGDVINDCDVTLYIRTTDDNPAGSPTWGPWTPFFVADFTCRAAQFKLDFISGNATHNIVIDQLAVHAKIPA